MTDLIFQKQPIFLSAFPEASRIIQEFWSEKQTNSVIFFQIQPLILVVLNVNSTTCFSDRAIGVVEYLSKLVVLLTH